MTRYDYLILTVAIFWLVTGWLGFGFSVWSLWSRRQKVRERERGRSFISLS